MNENNNYNGREKKIIGKKQNKYVPYCTTQIIGWTKSSNKEEEEEEEEDEEDENSTKPSEWWLKRTTKTRQI